MASNSFGTLFRITTWGESHGKAVGVVIDGCPAGLALTEEDIQQELDKRAPGRSPHTSPRKEPDRVEILSGLFEGKTTGTPISLLFWNQDVQSASYETTRHLLRPGHANYTYEKKYGHFDYRGGGRSSARETVCRVAAGAVAKKILLSGGITIIAHLQEMGGIACSSFDIAALRVSSLFCPDPHAEVLMQERLQAVQKAGDSLGGIVFCQVDGVPPGLGNPIYEKIGASLAKGILSIPACKGISFGDGFDAAKQTGSAHNDLPIRAQDGSITMRTNHAGGMLGGISTGMPITFSSAFKPTSSINQNQETCSFAGEKATLSPHPLARHDPCVAIRAVPVVEAMTALVLVDAYLLQNLSRI